MLPLKNELFRQETTGELRRVLWVSPTGAEIVWICVGDKIVEPTISSREEWEIFEASPGGVVSVPEDKYIRLINEDDPLLQDLIQRRDAAWDVISGLVSDEPNIYRSRYRSRVKEAAAFKSGLHKDTIRNYMFLYWTRGMTRNALIQNYDKCGNRRQRKPDGEVKKGRPRSVSPGKGINIDFGIQRIFEVGIKKWYLKNKKITKKKVWQNILIRWFSDSVKSAESGKIVLKESGDYPTYEQFCYWYDVIRGDKIKEDAEARKGKKYYERTLRPLLGNSTSEAIGPGFRYQIDATIADVYLVSKADRRQIIGRPVVYVVIDVWSRMIVGLYVGIERASWLAAMMAILNAASDKVEFCRKFGIEIEGNEWAASGLSAVMLADRGEGISSFSDQLKTLGIKVENTPPYRADWKGIVERMFGVLPASFDDILPGYIEVDYQERGGHDYRLDATLNLDEFTQLMILAVLEHNAATISGYPLSVELMRAGVTATPNELWDWGIKYRSGMRRTYSDEVLKFGLMHTDKASVTESGIEFKGRTYECKRALAEGWLTKARKKRWSVPVSYDPRCLDELLLHDAIAMRNFEVCTLKSDDPDDFGLSLQEWLGMRVGKNRTVAAKRHQELERTVNYRRRMDKVIENARASKKARGPDNRSKAERTGAIRDNASLEKKSRRTEERFVFQAQASPDEVVDANVNSESDPISSKNPFDMPDVLQIKERQG